MPATTATIFVSTGELSGDMHAALAIRALAELRHAAGLPPAVVDANGSHGLRAAGANLLHDVATWSEIGLLPSFVKAPMYLRAMQASVRYILQNNHDMVLLVDSRVMNLRIARALRQQGYRGRIVYYVAPVRWESLYDERERERGPRMKRFQDVKLFCDLAIPIYPISLEVYQELGIEHIFPGHPLCEAARPRLSDTQFSQLTGIPYDRARPPLLVGTLCGSRRGEIAQIAPPIFSALRLLREALDGESHLPPLYFATVIAHNELRPQVIRAARRAGVGELALLDSEFNYDLMARASLMIVKSGTSLHECMLLGVPSMMCYRVAPSLAWIARNIMKFSMPYYGFPNLLAGKPVVPELIQEDCRYTRIAEQAGELLFDEQQRADMLAEFDKLRARVCRPQVLRTVAEALQSQLKG